MGQQQNRRRAKRRDELLSSDEFALNEREVAVLRAMITAYVGEASPIGSQTLSHLVPMSLSAASIRSILTGLTERGLVEKPHASAGRVPTDRGLRLYVDELLDHGDLAGHERRTIEYSVDAAEADTLVDVTSRLLSECTRQLGFVVAPRLDRAVLRHVSLVRLSSERVLVVLVAQSGTTYRRVLVDGELDQADLDRVGALLSERVAGRTLVEVRAALAREARQLRRHADRLLTRAIHLGTIALAADEDVDLVLGTRLALLDQPEFRDPRRIRDLFAALETKERLIDVLERMLDDDEVGVGVVFGDELDEPGLQRCALVAARYGRGDTTLGALGVIGPSRMDYARVIPLVEFLSQAVTEKLSA